MGKWKDVAKMAMELLKAQRENRVLKAYIRRTRPSLAKKLMQPGVVSSQAPESTEEYDSRVERQETEEWNEQLREEKLAKAKRARLSLLAKAQLNLGKIVEAAANADRLRDAHAEYGKSLSRKAMSDHDRWVKEQDEMTRKSLVPPGPDDHPFRFTSEVSQSVKEEPEPKWSVGELIDLGNFQGRVAATLGLERYAIEWFGESPDFLRTKMNDEREVAYWLKASRCQAGDVVLVSKLAEKPRELVILAKSIGHDGLMPRWSYLALPKSGPSDGVPIMFYENSILRSHRPVMIPVGTGVYNSHRGRGLVNNQDQNRDDEVAVKWFDWTDEKGSRIEWCKSPLLERMAHALPVGARVHVPRNVRAVCNGQFDLDCYDGGTLMRYENAVEVEVQWDKSPPHDANRVLFLSLLAPGEAPGEAPARDELASSPLEQPLEKALLRALEEKLSEEQRGTPDAGRYAHFPTPSPASPTEEAPESEAWSLGDVVFVDGRERGRIIAGQPFDRPFTKVAISLDRGYTIPSVNVSRLSRHTEHMPDSAEREDGAIYDETHEEYIDP